jgi:DNA polymerase (family 10)
MTNAEVANVLSQIGTMLELRGENPFRCQAYHNAARAVEQLEGNVADLVASGELDGVRGLGVGMREKIATLVSTGDLPEYDELKASLPAGLFEMLRLPGIGPKKVKALYDNLHIDTMEKLRAACETGAVAKLKGFGLKTQQKILEGIAFLGEAGQRLRIDQVLPLADAVLGRLRRVPGVQRSAVCGSLRRRRETVKDIDLVFSAADPKPLMEAFVNMPEVVTVTGHGETKSSVVMAITLGNRQVHLNADLRVVSDDQYPLAVHHFTGSKDHNVALRGRAQKMGLTLNEYAFAGPDRTVKVKDEADIYTALGLDYVPPELREDTGEVAAAEQHRLPGLVDVSDIKGVFHNHTNYSDGGATLEEMALAAKALGLKYLGIADHSQSLTIANGLTPERVRQQQNEIDKLNARLSGIHLFKGTECDILADGTLDFDDELLGSFDYVVASVHSHFGQSLEEMTARIVRAVRHPLVTMLGHATGRLLLRREGYKVDLDAVLRAAAEAGTMVEINAQPSRLDLDWVHCKRAKALGIMLVINPDAHSPEELGLYRYGVDVARRGWLEAKDVFNTQTLAQVKKALAAGKKGASK